MTELSTRISIWMQSVLNLLPADIRAIYIEYGDAYAPGMEHLICFNAFGFESLAGGRFDPANTDHVGELGDFTWELPDGYRVRADDHPGADWLEILQAAAKSPTIESEVRARGVQLVVGEHDGEVFVIA